MSPSSSRWSESWRVLAITAALAVAFIALERSELALLDVFGANDVWMKTRTAGDDEKLAAEAAAIASQSRRAWASLPPGHRLAAFRLGFEVGWASEFAGSYATSAPNVQARAAQVAAAHLAIAREQARLVGIDPGGVAMLPTRTLGDFVALGQRFEADESGMAQRVEERLTPLHRHLFLLGVHLGAAAETLESSGGKFSDPPGMLIHRHATLAGIPAPAWQPLLRDERGTSPALVLEHHRAALARLMAELADDSLDGAASDGPARR